MTVGAGLGAVDVTLGNLTHNEYVRLLVETGALGLAATIILYWNLFDRAMEGYRRAKTPYRARPDARLAHGVRFARRDCGSDNIIVFPVLEWYFWSFAAVIVVMSGAFREIEGRDRETALETEIGSPRHEGPQRQQVLLPTRRRRDGLFRASRRPPRARPRGHPLRDAAPVEPAVALCALLRQQRRVAGGGRRHRRQAGHGGAHPLVAGGRGEDRCPRDGDQARYRPPAQRLPPALAVDHPRPAQAGRAGRAELHDYKLVCPAYTLYANGAICERCKGGRFYNATLQGCVKDSRFKSALCTAEAYLHGALGAYKRYVKFYIAPSRFLGAKVVELGLDPRRVVYVPNCVEPPPVPASEPEGRYFLYAGRLERVKGLQTLLEAVAGSAVARGHELWIAGEGDIRTDLEAFCAAQNLSGVRFLGHLTPADLEPVLQNARFAVVPSEWYENMPLSVLEAAGRGKAVIVSDMGGLPETVVPEETGIVFRAGEVQELRAAIERMLLEPERTREMGRKARAFIQETYSPERHYAGIMGVYERVLGTNAADGGLTEGVA